MDEAVKQICDTMHWTCEIKGEEPFRAGITNLQDSSHCSPGFGISAEAMAANAKLIAAAPELLVALKKIAAIKVTGWDGDYGMQAIAEDAISLAE